MLAISGVAALGLAATAIGIAGAFGVALAVLFTNFKKTNRDILRQDISDLRGRLDTVEESEKDCKARLQRAEATIVTLTEAVTKAAAVAELTKLVEEHHRSIMAKLEHVGPA